MTFVPGATQKSVALCISLSFLAIAAMAALTASPAKAERPGGISSQVAEEVGPEPLAPGSMAKLVRGRAIAPEDAPPEIRKVIAYANKIRFKPYVWGGGHGRWWDRGYDCSGAISFALHGGGLIEDAMPSGSMMQWGERGLGKWVTIFANRGHAYAVIAGLRWDTSGTGGNGPRWQEDMRSARGFLPRHPEGF